MTNIGYKNNVSCYKHCSNNTCSRNQPLSYSKTSIDLRNFSKCKFDQNNCCLDKCEKNLSNNKNSQLNAFKSMNNIKDLKIDQCIPKYYQNINVLRRISSNRQSFGTIDNTSGCILVDSLSQSDIISPNSISPPVDIKSNEANLNIKRSSIASTSLQPAINTQSNSYTKSLCHLPKCSSKAPVNPSTKQCSSILSNSSIKHSNSLNRFGTPCNLKNRTVSINLTSTHAVNDPKSSHSPSAFFLTSTKILQKTTKTPKQSKFKNQKPERNSNEKSDFDSEVVIDQDSEGSNLAIIRAPEFTFNENSENHENINCNKQKDSKHKNSDFIRKEKCHIAPRGSDFNILTSKNSKSNLNSKSYNVYLSKNCK